MITALAILALAASDTPQWTKEIPTTKIGAAWTVGPFDCTWRSPLVVGTNLYECYMPPTPPKDAVRLCKADHLRVARVDGVIYVACGRTQSNEWFGQ